MVLMAIEKPFVFLTKRRRTEIPLVYRVEMDLLEIAGIPDHVLTNVRTGQMKTYLFKIGDVLSPIKIGTITIPTLDGRTAAMSKAQEILVLDPLNVVDNSTMGNA